MSSTNKLKNWEAILDEQFEKAIESREDNAFHDLFEWLAFAQEKFFEVQLNETDSGDEEACGAHFERYHSGEIDSIIWLKHRTLIPPRHNIVATASINRPMGNCLLCYEHVNHYVEVMVNQKICAELLAPYIKSIIYFLIWEDSIVKKRAELESIPIFGPMISRIYFAEWTGSTVKSQMWRIDSKSNVLNMKLRKWIDLGKFQ